MTPKDVASQLRSMGFPVTSDTVINWIKTGIRINEKSRTVRVRLVAGKIGGRWFINSSHLVNFLKRTDPSSVLCSADSLSHTADQSAQ